MTAQPLAGSASPPGREDGGVRGRALPRPRSYQATVARAILERVIAREGGSISVEIARQGGKNELSAQVELVSLLTHAAAGGTIVKCAPTLDQARISLERLRRRAQGAGLGDAVRAAGGVASCGRAQARFLSAGPGANVIGHTADLLLEVDEAQDVEPEKFDRDFRPMAASTNAPVVLYGTPWGPRSLLQQAKAAHLDAERRDGRRRHFRFDWERVAAHVPDYGRYVEAERTRLGERHPLFRTQYLLEVVDESDRLLDGAALASSRAATSDCGSRDRASATSRASTSRALPALRRAARRSRAGRRGPRLDRAHDRAGAAARRRQERPRDRGR